MNSGLSSKIRHHDNGLFWRQETKLEWKNPWGEHTKENVTSVVLIAKRIPDNNISSKTVEQPVFTCKCEHFCGSSIHVTVSGSVWTEKRLASITIGKFQFFNCFNLLISMHFFTFPRWNNNTNLVWSFFRLSVPLICGSEEFKRRGSFRNLRIKNDFCN